MSILIILFERFVCVSPLPTDDKDDTLPLPPVTKYGYWGQRSHRFMLGNEVINVVKEVSVISGS